MFLYLFFLRQAKCIPRNEKLNELVRIKFLNLFLYTVVLNKNKNLLVQTKFYWSWASRPVLIVRTENGAPSSKRNGKDINIEHNLMIICTLCQKSEDNYLVNRKFTSWYNIKILHRLWEKIYVILILNFAHLKGK